MKNIFVLIIIVLFFIGCGRSKTPSPEREVGSNVLYNRFQIDEKGNIFVLKENGVKFLEWNGVENLNLIELPFKEKTENISGNKDTLIINTNGKLSILVNNKGLIEEIGKIDGFKICDKAIRQKGLVFVITGSSDCHFGDRNPSIKVFNFSEPKSISQTISIKLIDPKDLIFDNNLVFLADGNGGVKIFEKDANGSLKLISNFDKITANQLNINSKMKILIAKNQSEVIQFDYSNPSNLKLLSTIVLTK